MPFGGDGEGDEGFKDPEEGLGTLVPPQRRGVHRVELIKKLIF